MNNDTRTRAEATPCVFPECNGDTHDEFEMESRWDHTLTQSEFDNGLIEARATVRAGVVTADVTLQGFYFDAPSSELREVADRYEAFPAWLRSLADRMDSHTNK